MDAETKLIYKYLNRLYATQRIKNGGRFKKAIFIDGQQYLLKDKNNMRLIFDALFKIIIIVFDYPTKKTKEILIDFLNIKL